MMKQHPKILYQDDKIQIQPVEKRIQLLSSENTYFTNPESNWSNNIIFGTLHVVDDNGHILPKSQYYITVEYPVLYQHHLDGTIDKWVFHNGGYDLSNE